MAISPDKKTLDSLRINRSEARQSTWGVPLLMAVLTIGAVASGLTWWFNRPRVAVVRTMVVQAPRSGGGTTLLNASGYVTARREATVSSKVTGKVVEVFIEEGMSVDAGQMLARIDSSNVEKSLELAQAQLESARKALDETRANLDQANRELRRFTQLASNQAASRSELDRAETDATATQARLDRQTADVKVSEREVAVWEQQLDDTIIRAPFAGVVTSKDSQPGEMISPMSAGGGFTRTGICTIVDMSSLEIEVDVSESYINRVEPEQLVEATLDSYPEWRIPAKVIAIIPTADRQKATVRVRVGIEEPDRRILPEMSVKVAFQGSTEASTSQPRVAIPKAAVRQRDEQDIVWIVRDDRLERRAVTVGSAQGDQINIVAGLGGGERLVVESSDNLAEGAMVTEAK